jgi:hypothetical protein
MERIHYAGSSFVTGDQIAHALIDYAHYLTAYNKSASVDIPVRRADGTLGHANFLLGPTSQLVSVSEPDPGPLGEVVDDRLVASLRELSVVQPIARPRAVMSELSFDAFSLDYSDLTEYA